MIWFWLSGQQCKSCFCRDFLVRRQFKEQQNTWKSWVMIICIHVGEDYPQVPKACFKDWNQFPHFPKVHLCLWFPLAGSWKLILVAHLDNRKKWLWIISGSSRKSYCAVRRAAIHYINNQIKPWHQSPTVPKEAVLPQLFFPLCMPFISSSCPLCRLGPLA